MNTLKKPLLLVAALIMATLFLSWTLLDDPDSPSPSANSFNTIPLSTEDMLTFMAESGAGRGMPQQVNDMPPAAEDVLVQRIPGDNQHLLLMAFYSKENFSEPSFTIENGFTITLRDDGKEYDKTAGDGLYTAKIPVDVKAFRQQAMNMVLQMRKSGFKPLRYIHRAIVIDPDAAEDFEISRFDINEPISISGLTNALSGDLSAGSTASSNFSTTAKVAKPTLLDSIKKNSILITNLAVIEDSTRTWNPCTQTGNINGAWTFGTLMRQLATKTPLLPATDSAVSNFVKSWLNSWAVTQVINGDTVAARTLINTQVLNPWLTKSRNAGAPVGQLDMKFAPFKLTAITNRFDVRAGQKFGVPSSPCGEGRLVFCLIKSDCSAAAAMTVIFEYGVNKPNTCESIHNWAQQWVNLKNFTIGSSQYNQALQAITDQFTLCGTNVSKPNQSSLNQLRTNEVTFSPNPKQWELREFIVDSSTGMLKQSTVAQSPADKYNAQVINSDVQLLATFVNNNRKIIKGGNYTVPLIFRGVPFLGAKSRIIGKPTGNPTNIYYWDGTDSTNKPTFITDNDSRTKFSRETCAGCHAGETQTSFTHIDTVFFGKEAVLSGFLTGKASRTEIDFDNDSSNGKFTVKDAALRPSATSPNMISFNDINRRAQGLNSFINTTCGTVLGISSQLMFQPLNEVH